jgi:3-oxoacyl-[acyl-carrier-protein] synthase-3
MEILKRNQFKIEDIDLFVFHQASKLALESLTKILKIDPDKVFINIDKVGNTVSASIPIALKDAQQEKKIKNGDKVLCAGFGVGLSWGTCIFQF